MLRQVRTWKCIPVGKLKVVMIFNIPVFYKTYGSLPVS